MTDHFCETTISSLSELDRFDKPGWIFRGQRDAGWGLVTSLDRCFIRHGVLVSRRMQVEEDLIREFRRAYHHYSHHIPIAENRIEWLSLMQHHGAPTRLLDFTRSMYVACYFAVENADSDVAVWGINSNWAQRESLMQMLTAGRKKRHLKKFEQRLTEKTEFVIQKQLFKSSTPFACPITPFRLNERLRTQLGTFMLPGAIEDTFESNLTALRGHELDENVVKIKLPKKVVGQVLQKLANRNITRATLFPGLDGFAGALGVFHPTFMPNETSWYPAKS